MEMTKIQLRPAVQFIDLEDQGYWNDIIRYYYEHNIKHSNPLMNIHKEKIRQYQKQQPAKDMHVRPEKPDKDEFLKAGDKELYEKVYENTLQQWEKWQPVFVDENGKDWLNPDSVLAKTITRYKSIDHLLIMHESAFWNPDNGTVKGLYYPDK